MRFLIQMGHGMMAMNRELLQRFNDDRSAGVIIWPRTLERNQVERHAQEIRDFGASVLFDPCFYLPTTTLPRILDFPYWEGVDFHTLDFTGQQGIDFCRRVIDYQINTLDVTKVILPGRYTNVRNDDWLDMHAQFAESAADMSPGVPIYATVALGPDLIGDAASFDAVMNDLVQYPVQGVYLLYQSPNQDFLCDNDLFMMNLLTGCLSLSLAGKDVIIGYANQQDLIFAAAGVRTIATGNFRNVRSFDPAIFDMQELVERQRATWYYDGESLCEFRLQQLGLAYQRLGLRGEFGPETEYSKDMLQSANPANVRWSEPNAFKHYITVLRHQWMLFGGTPKRFRYQVVKGLHERALDRMSLYRERGLRLADRAGDTVNALPAWMSAIGSFVSTESVRLGGLNDVA